MTLAASTAMTAVVLTEIALMELKNPMTYRGLWICYRNRVDSVYSIFMDFRQTCRRADWTMKAVGFRDPVWPKEKWKRPIGR